MFTDAQETSNFMFILIIIHGMLTNTLKLIEVLAVRNSYKFKCNAR